MTYLITFILAFILVLVLVPLITGLAHRKGWYDAVGGRKIHAGQIPRLGGVGISLGFLAALPLAVVTIRTLYPALAVPGPSFWPLLAVGFGFHVLGLVDDFKNLSARLKFGLQFLFALLVVAAGFYFRVVEVPVPPYRIQLGFVGPILTVIWILGIVNAVNLIDGMDGLAAGISLIGAVVWAVLYYKAGQYLPALAATAMAGAVLGFLFYNFPPATIFMGDSGSLFLGFLLAILPLLGGPADQVETGLVPAITICLIPILDTLAAILRRWRRGVSFFTADKYHLHHKLLNLGFDARQILAIIYGLCTILGASVLASVYANPYLSFVLMMGGWIVSGMAFVLLHLLKERNVRLFK